MMACDISCTSKGQQELTESDIHFRLTHRKKPVQQTAVFFIVFEMNTVFSGHNGYEGDLQEKTGSHRIGNTVTSVKTRTGKTELNCFIHPHEEHE